MGPTWNRRLAMLLFALGVLLGIALAGVIAWGDMEAALFDAAISPQASLTTLNCPVMITTAETGTVSAVLNNPTDRPIRFFVRAHISEGHVTLMREARTWPTLAPGETQRLEWTVTPDDAAFGMVILVRVHVQSSGPLPYRARACGIVVLKLSFMSGTQLLALILSVVLLSTGSGIGLWVANSRPLIGRGLAVARAMGVLAGAVGIAIVVGLLGFWFVSVIVLLFTVLMIVVIVGYGAVSAA